MAIPTAEYIPGVGSEKFPASIIAGSKPALVRPIGESPAAAELTNRTVQKKSVIPKKRRLVKTMMYHAMKNFIKSVFRRKPSAGAPP
ncbi:hypothetical protein SDJN03_23382, partial [Cucurbita argyrosperma subsp. sororia]